MPMTIPIENYALLGDCITAALVSDSGSIDWLCFPRFDGAACFAALLGDDHNGCWKIAPHDASYPVRRSYRDGTMILETAFATPSGSALLIDFMPLGGETSNVVRIVAGVSGRVDFDMALIMRMDYGRIVPWVERAGTGVLTAVAGPDMLVLRTAAPLHAVDKSTRSHFSVSPGERVTFTLAHQPSHLPLVEGIDAEAELLLTELAWRRFSDRCPDVGPYSQQVKRSLITMKALTYRPTGGIVAAVTTSLPESIGGKRNWDYRYCWLRDATMTLIAFMKLGYFDEAHDWREWLLRSIAGNPEQMQIMYGLCGERRLPEMELPWLAGYEHSRPVRTGNAAASQMQLDVYGEMVDAMTQAVKGGLAPHGRGLAILKVIINLLEHTGHEPDHGIWEIRGAPRHYTHSKVMAWAAFDRLARWTAELRRDDEGRQTAERCRLAADAIHAQVCSEGYDSALGSFVQSYGAREVDAALLQIVLTGFLPPDDARVAGTIAVIEQRLMQGGLLRRYDTVEVGDCLPPGEGVFLICSFWLVDAYMLVGRRQDATVLYERLLGLCNDVGLLAEQYDPAARRMLGNFPQAFSHIGVINSALNLHNGALSAGTPAHSRASPPAKHA
jgi:GH15 family glucan-1,4-alpha-glucosidase